MGLWSRLQVFFQAKTSATLDRLEDPRETFDLAYAQQQELLRKVRQGLVEVATSKRQLDHQIQRSEARLPELRDQARRALAADRDDLARLSLQRRDAAVFELEDLRRQVREVAGEEHRLIATEQGLSARVEEFRTRRRVMSARYTAAEAQVRVGEALSGVSGDLAELGMALGRAEEKTERMQARAAALDALLDPSALSAPLTGGDSVEAQLRAATRAQRIEEELAVLRGELCLVELTSPSEEPLGIVGADACALPAQPPRTVRAGPPPSGAGHAAS